MVFKSADEVWLSPSTSIEVAYQQYSSLYAQIMSLIRVKSSRTVTQVKIKLGAEKNNLERKGKGLVFGS